MKNYLYLVFFWIIACDTHNLAGQHAAPEEVAKAILDQSNIPGGLVVHLGCADGQLTAALRTSDRYLVHGLDANRNGVEKARRHIESLGSYGPVSVGWFDGENLPYADDLVNLIVVSGAESQVSDDEIKRVLCPGGVAITMDPKNANATPQTFRKPWPEEIDEWTHYLRDASGNPVGKDEKVGPPRYLQWTAGPLWARNHGWTPSVSAIVSARGRLFYILDETTTGMDATVPSKWFLIARDAFNGVPLWKRPIPRWGSAAFSGTPDDGVGVAAVGRFTMPPHTARRLVAMDDTVYVTLGPAAPVTALDAMTGQVRRVYAETRGADEILFDNGRLLLVLNPPESAWHAPVPSDQTPPPAPGKQICAVDAETGTVLWKRGPFSGIRATLSQDPQGRLELCAGDGRVFALTPETIVCLDAESGDELWRRKRPALPNKAVTRLGYAGYFEYLLATLSYSHGVVLLAQPEPNTHHTYHTVPGTLYALDAATGKPMWQHAYGGWGHQTPPEVFIVDDVVWSHVNADAEFGFAWGKGYRAKDPSKVDYRIQALDLHSGQLVKEYSTKDIFNVGHHHRCYRNRITEKYLLSSRRGVEFVDLSTGENFQNHWVRSGCLIGNLPCNGLLYVTPHPCRCYINAKLTGFNALAAKRSWKGEERSLKVENRLERGPAYDEVLLHPSKFKLHTSSWPTYRHDPMRTGATEHPIDTSLESAWKADVGTQSSAPVVADGKVFVSEVDAHVVHAFRADTGKRIWRYTADARVDSPPTFHDGLVIFGSRAGHVHCLRATDGQLVWRFDAAPERRWITAFGQLESPWPVPGSVLIQDGKCWFAAGRSSYLDGGINIYALEPKTGAVLHEETVYSPDPQTAKMAVETDSVLMEGLLNDIPDSDGGNVFIRSRRVSAEGPEIGKRLLTTAGYLDSSWFNRTFWSYGAAQSTGLMVLGKETVYGVEPYERFGADNVFSPGAGAYRLRCLPTGESRVPGNQGRNRRNVPKPIWEERVGIRVTAMVRAADTVFVAGAPDLVDGEDPHGAWEGRKGGVLAAYNASSGEKIAEVTLPSPPVWDGMAAAEGGLYVSTMDGTVHSIR